MKLTFQRDGDRGLIFILDEDLPEKWRVSQNSAAVGLTRKEEIRQALTTIMVTVKSVAVRTIRVESNFEDFTDVKALKTALEMCEYLARSLGKEVTPSE